MQTHTDTDTHTHAKKHRHRQTQKQTLGGHVHAKPTLFVHACMQTGPKTTTQCMNEKTCVQYTTQYTTGDCEDIHTKPHTMDIRYTIE